MASIVQITNAVIHHVFSLFRLQRPYSLAALTPVGNGCHCANAKLAFNANLPAMIKPAPPAIRRIYEIKYLCSRK